jgi:hypothetical protein
MDLGKGLELEYKDGKIVLSADILPVLAGPLSKLKADIESGKIDPIHGTDLDKEFMLKAVDFVEKALVK